MSGASRGTLRVEEEAGLAVSHSHQVSQGGWSPGGSVGDTTAAPWTLPGRGSSQPAPVPLSSGNQRGSSEECSPLLLTQEAGLCSGPPRPAPGPQERPPGVAGPVARSSCSPCSLPESLAPCSASATPTAELLFSAMCMPLRGRTPAAAVGGWVRSPGHRLPAWI